mgnify:FL=1
MKKWCFAVSIIVLLAISPMAMASEPKTIQNWDNIRRDMELFKGALKQTVGSSVLSTYLPGYGVVFMFDTTKAIDMVKREVERALVFITPTISSLPEGERIAIVGYYGFYEIWELMYISNANTSSDPTTWDVYLNKTTRD